MVISAIIGIASEDCQEMALVLFVWEAVIVEF
jgi:hypothetical protein